MTAYDTTRTCIGLKNGPIGHYNAGWDHFFSMNKDQNLVVSSAKRRIYII